MRKPLVPTTVGLDPDRRQIDPAVSKAAAAILVVEDDRGSQQYIEVLLGNKYRLYFAESVTGARQVLSAIGACELILLDLSLDGEEDGLDLVRFLKNQEKWRQIPIVVTSAHVFIADKERCLSAGCVDYLTKPLARNKLLECVEHWIS
ncbi:MAG: response regulator [Candidatus Neomarinimicrobiota bacterium]